ncbi:RBBP9/YdeN family alpha/beta hydrolase [Mannheimia massilioguelmaensis]|uniref:RBBP9/YdeN family alpha/beta hydrolase n=1 Tax=Mannheimia massilioguelmaensis TaxID=1604354 RepID=UPI0005CACE13|nr:alpha/beta hydrolase [Mannheimia massilioguelmaensis]
MHKQLYITHGYTATSQSHWFQWLKNQLIPHQINVDIFNMPNSSKPEPAAWLSYHQKHIHQLDENTVFIAHSLGCIATLGYLQQKNTPIKGVILVAGFDRHLTNLPELNAFTSEPINYAKLICNIPSRLVIASLDDEIVNCHYSEELAKKLQAQYITLEKSGHFLARQGFTEFPFLLEQTLKIFEI